MQRGLEWELAFLTSFSVKPAWSEEPDLEAIKNVVSTVLDLPQEELSVEFYAQGALNKVYKVIERTRQKVYIMRVSLPVDPKSKTLAEVNTLAFLEKQTNVPVPRVLAYNDFTNNAIGFEWILMSFVPGRPLRSCWHNMDLLQKRSLILEIVGYHVQIFRNQFPGIGALKNHEQSALEIGRIVSIPFWWMSRADASAHKGPFENAEQWLSAMLDIMQTDTMRLIKLECEKPIDEQEDFSNVLEVIKRFQKLLPDVFERMPKSAMGFESKETTILQHPDLSFSNIMVDPETFKITGVIDWENVSALPVQAACQLPHLLGHYQLPRYEAPQPSDYADCNPSVDTEYAGGPLKKSDIYYEHLLEYEQTQLQAFFLDEMSRICPEWISHYELGKDLRDLVDAVSNADNNWSYRYVVPWLDAVENGERRSLRECWEETQRPPVDDDSDFSYDENDYVPDPDEEEN